ncbi:MAG TPA: hypothetical protein VLL97_10060 [Acidobacteriota bacterium]|nr:hypothetical protein [Acidobacteriota bacterium]
MFGGIMMKVGVTDEVRRQSPGAVGGRERRLPLLPVIVVLLLFPVMTASSGAENMMTFGRDTVLVWNIRNAGFESHFVVRLASFSPDIYFEWENEKTQGKVFIPQQDVANAKDYITSRFFAGGREIRSRNATTIWLSRKIYADLKEKKRVRYNLDGVATTYTLIGEDTMAVEVNQSVKELPVLIVDDGRGGERWFLDCRENPLLMRHRLRNYDKILAGITTDRKDTLRWIKGRKLTHPPR